MNNLSTTVKLLRKQYNLTQEELSLKSGGRIALCARPRTGKGNAAS